MTEILYQTKWPLDQFVRDTNDDDLAALAGTQGSYLTDGLAIPHLQAKERGIPTKEFLEDIWGRIKDLPPREVELKIRKQMDQMVSLDGESTTADGIPAEYLGLALESSSRKHLGFMQAKTFQTVHAQLLSVIGCDMSPGNFAFTHEPSSDAVTGIILFTRHIANPKWDPQADSIYQAIYISFETDIGWIHGNGPQKMPHDQTYVAVCDRQLKLVYQPWPSTITNVKCWGISFRCWKAGNDTTRDGGIPNMEYLNGYPGTLMACLHGRDVQLRYSTINFSQTHQSIALGSKHVMGLYTTGHPVIFKTQHYYKDSDQCMTLGNAYATTDQYVIKTSIGNFLGQDCHKILRKKDPKNLEHQQWFFDQLITLGRSENLHACSTCRAAQVEELLKQTQQRI